MKTLVIFNEQGIKYLLVNTDLKGFNNICINSGLNEEEEALANILYDEGELSHLVEELSLQEFAQAIRDTDYPVIECGFMC